MITQNNEHIPDQQNPSLQSTEADFLCDLFHVNHVNTDPGKRVKHVVLQFCVIVRFEPGSKVLGIQFNRRPTLLWFFKQ